MTSERQQPAGRFDERQYYPGPEVLRQRLEEHPARDEILAYLEGVGAPPEAILSWPEVRVGVLSDRAILRHILAGNIVIEPFRSDNLQSNGYDVRLGEYFYVYNDSGQYPRTLNLSDALQLEEERMIMGYPIYNPQDPEDVRRSWKGPLIAEPIEQLLGEEISSKGLVRGINQGEKVIQLMPGEMILAHTQEFVGGRNVVTTTISGKSTSGRNMIEVCNDANLGDVGFCSRWTLEIRNKSNKPAILVPVGIRIATVQFSGVEAPLRQYSGRYQVGATVEEIVSSWKPEMMLPKMERLK